MDGFIQFATNQELTQKIINKDFEDCGLLLYLFNDYPSTQWYLNAREESDNIISKVARVEITITTEDIRSVYGLPIATTIDVSSHSFNQGDFFFLLKLEVPTGLPSIISPGRKS